MKRLIHFQCKGLRKISGATSKLRLAVFVAVAVVMLQGVDAQASFSGFSDLTIEGDVTFDTDSLWVDGSPVISGSFSKTVGGSTTSSAFNDTGVTSGDNPQSGVLTGIGDGFGIVTNASGPDGAEIDVLGLDLTMYLDNSSADSFWVTIGLDFSNSIDADGDDGYISSEFTLEDPDGEIFFTDLTSDTYYGDMQDGGDLGTYGALVSDSGILSWDILLGPGEDLLLEGFFSMSAGAFDTASYIGNFNANLTVTGVTLVTDAIIPVPGALLLGSIGVACVGCLRWRLT